MKVGDRVTLIDEISPNYLAGAVVEVTEQHNPTLYTGKIDGFRYTPPENGRFRLGGTIRFRDSHVNEAVQPPQHNGKPAPRIISVRALLLLLYGEGVITLTQDDRIERALGTRGMSMDTAFTYDAQP